MTGPDYLAELEARYAQAKVEEAESLEKTPEDFPADYERADRLCTALAAVQVQCRIVEAAELRRKSEARKAAGFERIFPAVLAGLASALQAEISPSVPGDGAGEEKPATAPGAAKE